MLDSLNEVTNSIKENCEKLKANEKIINEHNEKLKDY